MRCFRAQEMLGDVLVTDEDFAQLLRDVGDIAVLVIPLVCHPLQIQGGPGSRVLLERGGDVLGRGRFRTDYSNSLRQGMADGPSLSVTNCAGTAFDRIEAAGSLLLEKR